MTTLARSYISCNILWYQGHYRWSWSQLLADSLPVHVTARGTKNSIWNARNRLKDPQLDSCHQPGDGRSQRGRPAASRCTRARLHHRDDAKAPLGRTDAARVLRHQRPERHDAHHHSSVDQHKLCDQTAAPCNPRRLSATGAEDDAQARARLNVARALAAAAQFEAYEFDAAATYQAWSAAAYTRRTFCRQHKDVSYDGRARKQRTHERAKVQRMGGVADQFRDKRGRHAPERERHGAAEAGRAASGRASTHRRHASRPAGQRSDRVGAQGHREAKRDGGARRGQRKARGKPRGFGEGEGGDPCAAHWSRTGAGMEAGPAAGARRHKTVPHTGTRRGVSDWGFRLKNKSERGRYSEYAETVINRMLLELFMRSGGTSYERSTDWAEAGPTCGYDSADSGVGGFGERRYAHFHQHGGFGAASGTGSGGQAGGARACGRAAGHRVMVCAETAAHLKSMDLTGVPSSEDALKDAYRAAAKRYHPDAVGADGASVERFRRVREAFDFLRRRV